MIERTGTRMFSRALEIAMQSWLDESATTQSGESATSRALDDLSPTPEERMILTAVLEMMRDPHACPVHLPVLRALLGLPEP